MGELFTLGGVLVEHDYKSGVGKKAIILVVIFDKQHLVHSRKKVAPCQRASSGDHETRYYVDCNEETKWASNC